MDTLDQVKQKINIVDLVSSYIEIKKAGRNYKGVCPFHSEKTPSLMVSPELQIFKCFGCGEGGDIFKFYQGIEGVDFLQSLEALAEQAGVKLEKRATDPNWEKKKRIYKINKLSAQFYNYLLTEHKIGKEAFDYVKKKRKLTKATIEKFNIGYAPNSWDNLYQFLKKKKFSDEELLEAGVVSKKRSGNGYIDRFRKRIMFPFIEPGGKVVGFTGRILGEGTPKYLNTSETPVFYKSTFVFGLDKGKVAIKKNGVIFCEGQLDVITANQAGFENVVASSGTSLTAGQLRTLKRYTDDITFAFDSDTAGDNAIRRAIELAEKEGLQIKVAVIPDKYADLDELINADKDLAKDILTNTFPAYDFFLISALKRHSKKDPIGKQKIMQELSATIGKITDPVLKDHYVKKIALEVGVTESVVAEVLSKKTSEKSSFTPAAIKKEPIQKASRRTDQSYLLALLLRSPLDISQAILYKLGQKDFTDPNLQIIFTELKRYLVGRKRKFVVKFFIKRFETDLKNLTEELCMWDLGNLSTESNSFKNEVEATFQRVKKKTAKRELKELSEQIRQAEMEKDTKTLKELTKEFKQLSDKLI